MKILLLDFSTKKHTFLGLRVSIPGTTEFTGQVMILSNNGVINFTLLVVFDTCEIILSTTGKLVSALNLTSFYGYLIRVFVALILCGSLSSSL